MGFTVRKYENKKRKNKTIVVLDIVVNRQKLRQYWTKVEKELRKAIWPNLKKSLN